MNVVGPTFTIAGTGPATAGTPYNFTVTAVDASNATDTGYTGPVSFTSSDAAAMLPAGNTLSNGTGTFAITFKTASPPTQTITATDSTRPSIVGTSAGITVNAAAISQFVITGSPTTVAAGSPVSFTVTAEDTFNNIARNYTGTVHFTSSDPLVTPPANTTLTAGVGTFSVTLKTVGSQTLTAKDVAGTATGTSNAISVTPLSAAKFSLTTPLSVAAGSQFNFTVTVQDTFGNTITSGYTGTVHFSKSDVGVGSALPADYTFTVADHGVHAFTGTSGAILVTAPTQTITATDALTSITGSQVVTVTAGAPAKLAILNPTTTIVAGTPFTITVEAQDSFGNLATGYTGTVQFTKSDAANRFRRAAELHICRQRRRRAYLQPWRNIAYGRQPNGHRHRYGFSYVDCLGKQWR